MLELNDTIVAIATPPGVGGVAIIRLSGNNSLSILSKVFVSSAKSFKLTPRFMHYGQIKDNDTSIDDVLAVYMPGPNSFTGEDVVEVHCHGGVGVVNSILELLISLGARVAKPGEFTKRSFLNNRIDLTQAEAISELIAAPSKEGVLLAKSKLDGELSKTILELKRKIEDLRTKTIISIDFSEDVDDEPPVEFIVNEISEIIRVLSLLIDNYERAKLWREGACVVLAGQSNAGKSSLFNFLLGRSRALVSSVAGTTRDYLEEQIYIGGFLVRILDTAGFRITTDSIEIAGMEQANTLTKDADLILLVVDGVLGLTDLEYELLEKFEKSNIKNIIVVINKCDSSDFLKDSYENISLPVIKVSAKNGLNIDSLIEAIKDRLLFNKQSLDTKSELVPNLRQRQALTWAKEKLENAKDDLINGYPIDTLEDNLSSTVELLDEITGVKSKEELIDNIFSNFCIGK